MAGGSQGPSRVGPDALVFAERDQQDLGAVLLWALAEKGKALALVDPDESGRLASSFSFASRKVLSFSALRS